MRARFLSLVLLGLVCTGANAGSTRHAPAAAHASSLSAKPSTSKASFAVRANILFTKTAQPVIDKVTVNLAGRSLSAARPGGSSSQLRLGRLIAKGFNGAVYTVDLDPATREQLVGSFQGDVVAKIPHEVNLPGHLHVPGAVHAVNEEIGINQLLLNQLPEIERVDGHASAPAWGRGKMPSIPILAKLETSHGPVLLKPFAKGTTLEEIGKNGGLTDEMRASLQEVHGFVRAVSATVKTYGGGKAFALDARPANLIWMHEPGALKSLGLSRPSFVFFELGSIPIKTWTHISLDNYVKAVELEGAGAVHPHSSN